MSVPSSSRWECGKIMSSLRAVTHFTGSITGHAKAVEVRRTTWVANQGNVVRLTHDTSRPMQSCDAWCFYELFPRSCWMCKRCSMPLASRSTGSIAGRRGDYEAPANEATHNHLGKRSNAPGSQDLLNNLFFWYTF